MNRIYPLAELKDCFPRKTGVTVSVFPIAAPINTNRVVLYLKCVSYSSKSHQFLRKLRATINCTCLFYFIHHYCSTVKASIVLSVLLLSRSLYYIRSKPKAHWVFQWPGFQPCFWMPRIPSWSYLRSSKWEKN